MAAQLAEPKPKRISKRKPYKVDPIKTVALIDMGLPVADVAKHQHVAPVTIYRFLDRIHKQKQDIGRYRANLSDSMLQAMMESAEIAGMIRNHWMKNPDAILKCNDIRLQKEVMYACEGAKTYNHTQYRLENDMSTSNIASIHADVAAMRALAVDKDHLPTDVRGCVVDNNDPESNT
jgi:hypothetical protein